MPGICENAFTAQRWCLLLRSRVRFICGLLCIKPIRYTPCVALTLIWLQCSLRMSIDVWSLKKRIKPIPLRLSVSCYVYVMRACVFACQVQDHCTGRDCITVKIMNMSPALYTIFVHIFRYPYLSNRMWVCQWFYVSAIYVILCQ